MQEHTESAGTSMNESMSATLEKLTRLGYHPEVDSEGDIKVYKEGIPLYVFLKEADQSYYQLATWGRFDDNPTIIAMAALRVAERMRVIKVLPLGGRVAYCVECYHATIDAFLGNIERYFRLLLAGIRAFDDERQEVLASQATAGSKTTSQIEAIDDAALVL